MYYAMSRTEDGVADNRKPAADIILSSLNTSDSSNSVRMAAVNAELAELAKLERFARPFGAGTGSRVCASSSMNRA